MAQLAIPERLIAHFLDQADPCESLLSSSSSSSSHSCCGATQQRSSHHRQHAEPVSSDSLTSGTFATASHGVKGGSLPPAATFPPSSCHPAPSPTTRNPQHCARLREEILAIINQLDVVDDVEAAASCSDDDEDADSADLVARPAGYGRSLSASSGCQPQGASTSGRVAAGRACSTTQTGRERRPATASPKMRPTAAATAAVAALLSSPGKGQFLSSSSGGAAEGASRRLPLQDLSPRAAALARGQMTNAGGSSSKQEALQAGAAAATAIVTISALAYDADSCPGGADAAAAAAGAGGLKKLRESVLGSRHGSPLPSRPPTIDLQSLMVQSPRRQDSGGSPPHAGSFPAASAHACGPSHHNISRGEAQLQLNVALPFAGSPSDALPLPAGRPRRTASAGDALPPHLGSPAQYQQRLQPRRHSQELGNACLPQFSGNVSPNSEDFAPQLRQPRANPARASPSYHPLSPRQVSPKVLAASLRRSSSCRDQATQRPVSPEGLHCKSLSPNAEVYHQQTSSPSTRAFARMRSGKNVGRWSFSQRDQARDVAMLTSGGRRDQQLLSSESKALSSPQMPLMGQRQSQEDTVDAMMASHVAMEPSKGYLAAPRLHHLWPSHETRRHSFEDAKFRR